MSKNVMFILGGLAVILVICFYLQNLAVTSLSPQGDDLVIPDTHQKIQKFAKSKRQ